MIEVKLWYKHKPTSIRIAELKDTQNAGVFLAGEIQTAVDSGSTLVAEITERKTDVGFDPEDRGIGSMGGV